MVLFVVGLLQAILERGVMFMKDRITFFTPWHGTAEGNCALFVSSGRKTYGTEYFIRDG